MFSVIGVCVVKKKFSTKLRKYKITFSSETWFEIIAYALTLASLRFIIVASHSQLNSSPPFFSTLRLPPLITPSPLHNLHPDHNLQTHLQRQLNRSFKFRSLNPILSTIPPCFFSLLLSTSHSLNFVNPHSHLQDTEDTFKKSSTHSKNQPYASPTAQTFITDLATHT